MNTPERERPQRGAQRSLDNPRTSRRRTYACVMLLVIGSGVLGTWWVTSLQRTTDPRLEPPLADLRQASPAVAELVTEHRTKVLRQPRSGLAWGQLGMVYFAHQFEPEAARCFEQAEALDATDYRWPYLWALTLGVVDPERAEQGYHRAIELRPGAAHVHTRLGELLLAAERYQEAEDHFQRAKIGDEHDARARLGAARVALRRNELDAALHLARDAARLAPETHDVHELLARLHHLSGDRQAAIKERDLASRYEQSDLSWNDPIAEEVVMFRRDAHWILQEASALAQNQQVDRAARLIQSVIADDDRDPQLHVALSQYLIQLRELDQASQFLDKALRRHPDAVELRFQLGVAEFLKQRYPEAKRQFLAVLTTRPDHYLAHYNLGHTYLKQVDPARALEAFLRAAEFRPDYVDAQIKAAELLREQGRKGEAVEHLRTVLRFSPDNAQARKLLAELE